MIPKPKELVDFIGEFLNFVNKKEAEMKEIILNPEESVADDRIVDMFHHLTGHKKALKILSNSLGEAEYKLWEEIKERYPEVEEGSWSFKFHRGEFKIIQTSKPDQDSDDTSD